MRKAKSLFISVCLSFVVVASCGDRSEWFYASLADADKADAGARSWVRNDLLPGRTRNIHIAGELSPSKEWCAFEFSPAESDSLRKKLKPIEALPPSFRRVSNPGARWWPAVLKGNLEVDKIRKAGFELYIVEEQANSAGMMDILLFAIDWQKGNGFFYETYEPGPAVSRPGS
jgi:hypothetical protein